MYRVFQLSTSQRIPTVVKFSSIQYLCSEDLNFVLKTSNKFFFIKTRVNYEVELFDEIPKLIKSFGLMEVLIF